MMEDETFGDLAQVMVAAKRDVLVIKARYDAAEIALKSLGDELSAANRAVLIAGQALATAIEKAVRA